CYLAFLAAFLYLIGFVGNFVVPRSVDAGVSAPIGEAVMVNLLLLGLFAVQHSVMARPAFKSWWTRCVPPAIERSTYVLIASSVLVVLYWQWRTMPGIVWDVTPSAGRLVLHGLFWLGWAIALAATFMINHFDLFGLRQVYLAWRGRPYTDLGFRTFILYRLVRHPLMLGFIIAFWATPTRSAGLPLFEIINPGTVLAALKWGKRTLVAEIGPPYRDYQRRVPILIPRPRGYRESAMAPAEGTPS